MELPELFRSRYLSITLRTFVQGTELYLLWGSNRLQLLAISQSPTKQTKIFYKCFKKHVLGQLASPVYDVFAVLVSAWIDFGWDLIVSLYILVRTRFSMSIFYTVLESEVPGVHLQYILSVSNTLVHPHIKLSNVMNISISTTSGLCILVRLMWGHHGLLCVFRFWSNS
jgi:hypothetical protein